MTKRKRLELYWEVTNPSLRILDMNGKEYTPDQARELYRAGKLTDFNLAFQRLVNHDFDVKAARASYDS